MEIEFCKWSDHFTMAICENSYGFNCYFASIENSYGVRNVHGLWISLCTNRPASFSKWKQGKFAPCKPSLKIRDEYRRCPDHLPDTALWIRRPMEVVAKPEKWPRSRKFHFLELGQLMWTLYRLRLQCAILGGGIRSSGFQVLEGHYCAQVPDLRLDRPPWQDSYWWKPCDPRLVP